MSREAIEDITSGVTRDRHYGRVEWNGEYFSLIDTGGYVPDSKELFEKEIRKQVSLAIEEADLILFVLDVTQGITPLDKSIADILRRIKGGNIIVVANKSDNYSISNMGGEFYGLGLGEVYPVSSKSGSGTGDLLDEVINKLGNKTDEELPGDIPRIAVAGRPNVGKSSFINVLLGEERQIVTEVAGTTCDSIDTRFKKFGMDIILIDTAGLRKKSKEKEDVEFYSVLRSVRVRLSAVMSVSLWWMPQ